ncbi:MAG: DUF1194 domain-containing protein [Rhodospirillales bacterium]|nr:DUF1194 domain-containing protein [Rhodospirillales bacterium]
MVKQTLKLLPALILAGTTLCGAARAQSLVPVDLELAFVVDASGSIDDDEFHLQRQGYADALLNPKVLSAIGTGFLGSIAVAYIEFSADGCTELSVPWTRISDPASARAFGDQILAKQRYSCSGGNAIGEGVALAATTIDSNEFEGMRRVIDVSGDGPNTMGVPVEMVRDVAVANRMTINGLVIERPEMPDLDAYFRSSVTGGRRSFVIKAENRQSFAAAILKKMILEIADISTLKELKPWQ